MFQLGVFLFLSLTVSLSSGQDVTLSESSSSSGTCNITSCSCHWDSRGARVSCDVNTCFEAFNGSGNCFSSDSEFRCSQRSEESGSSLSNTCSARQRSTTYIYGLSFVLFHSEPYACHVLGSACPRRDHICLCRSHDYKDSEKMNPFLALLSIGFGLVLFFLPIIIFFNINLASGPNHSCVFFYQCAPLASTYGSLTAVLVMQNFFLPDQPGFIFLECFKYIVVIVVIFLIFFLVKCTCCPLQKCRLPWAKVRRAVRNFREKHIGSTFIHAICSIIVLSYGDLVAISVRVSLGSLYIDRDCCYSVSYNVSYDGLVHCDESFMVYFDRIFHIMALSPIVSAGIAIVLLLLPLSLIYYPSIPALFHKLTGRSLPRFPKLDPVFDMFQGVYKDKMRWFAGVHLLYLIILWVVYLRQPDVIPFFFVLILAIHSLFQPFKNPKHNYLETLYLVNLSLMSFGNSYLLNASTTAENFEDYHSKVLAVAIVSSILLALPAFLVFVICCYKILSKRVCCQRCVSTLKSCCSREDSEQEPLIPEQLILEENSPLHEVEWST